MNKPKADPFIFPRCPHTARDGHSRCGYRVDANGRHEGFHAPGNGSGKR